MGGGVRKPLTLTLTLTLTSILTLTTPPDLLLTLSEPTLTPNHGRMRRRQNMSATGGARDYNPSIGALSRTTTLSTKGALSRAATFGSKCAPSLGTMTTPISPKQQVVSRIMNTVLGSAFEP